MEQFIQKIKPVKETKLKAVSAQIGYIVPQEYDTYHVGPGGQDKRIIKQWNNTLNQENHKHSPPWLGFLRGVFLANHLAWTNNLTRTTKKQHVPT